MSFDIFIGQHH